MIKKVLRLPENLFIVTASVLFLISFILKKRSIDIHLHATMYVISLTQLLWATIIALLLLWVLYKVAGNILRNKYLSWFHILSTLIVLLVVIVACLWKKTPEGKDLSWKSLQKGLRWEKIIYVSLFIFVITGQIAFIINLMSGFLRNRKLKAYNMEVHHHPDLHHKKKKWKEYLLEFLMIFLAVTLGFFAETFRESISEKHREKDYIEGLVNNIKNDTTVLSGLINRNDLELKGIDSLIKTSKNNFQTLSVQDSIYFYAVKYAITLHLFQFNDLTLVQLRNAGGYSLIKTSRVADSIALYEANNNEIKLQERFVTEYYVQTWDSFKQIFDGTLSNDFLRSYKTTNRIPDDVNVLISKDEEKMHLLFNNCWTFAITINGYNTMLRQHLEYLNSFLSFLKTTYDIE